MGQIIKLGYTQIHTACFESNTLTKKVQRIPPNQRNYRQKIFI